MWTQSAREAAIAAIRAKYFSFNEVKQSARMRPGGGGRFAKLQSSLSKKPGITNPGALAAHLGRQKYGAKKMAKFSAMGRSRAARK